MTRVPLAGRSHRRRAASIVGLVVATVAVCSGCATSAPSPTSGSHSTPAARAAAAAGDRYPFGRASFWRSSLVGAPVDPDSRAMVDLLVSTIEDRYGGIAAFNAHQYNSHLYTVTATTPRVDFAFSNCQGKPSTPSGLLGPGGQFTDVPVPAGAVPAVGTDAEISFYSPSTDQVWEFWKAEHAADGTWSACWGGRLDHASTSPGYFRGGFGATATGLPNAGGAVRLSEARAGRIDHAISIAIPRPAVFSDVSWPAQRSDGFDTDPAALREGARLRLDPALDLSTLQLGPTALAIARAAQRYGFVVVDKAGSVSVIAEAVDEVDGTDPWRTLLQGPDYTVLKNFPWSSLQVIRKDHGRPTDPTPEATP